MDLVGKSGLSGRAAENLEGGEETCSSPIRHRIVTDIGRNFTQTTITSRHHIRSHFNESHFNVTHEAILRKETGLPNLSPSAACSVCRNGGWACTVAHLSKIGKSRPTCNIVRGRCKMCQPASCSLKAAMPSSVKEHEELLKRWKANSELVKTQMAGWFQSGENPYTRSLPNFLPALPPIHVKKKRVNSDLQPNNTDHQPNNPDNQPSSSNQ
jgi:hypothetical protein